MNLNGLEIVGNAIISCTIMKKNQGGNILC